MIRETTYNDVFDSQIHFRCLLEALSRPGTIQTFKGVSVTPPEGFDVGSAFIAFALLDTETRYSFTPVNESIDTYIRMNTGAQNVEMPKAEFIFAPSDCGPEIFDAAETGISTYPETGSTVVLRASNISDQDFSGGLTLTIKGPGVETESQVCISGLKAQTLEAWKSCNIEFPLGVDVFVVAPGESANTSRVVGIPRSAILTLS